MRTTSDTLQYTESEIRSYLPSGWDILGDRQGAWDSKKKVWHATVLDNVDFDWPIEVEAAEVTKVGRMEALRLAMDRLYRERLG